MEAIAAPPAPRADVFLSHAGSEKRHIVNAIHRELSQRGIDAFVDYGMELGTDATQAMLEAASKGARVGVLVLSREFFRREWPVREARIMLGRYRRTPRNMELVLLFYDVEPWAQLDTDGLQEGAQALFGQLCEITGHVQKPVDFLMDTAATIAAAVEGLLPPGSKRASCPCAQGVLGCDALRRTHR